MYAVIEKENTYKVISKNSRMYDEFIDAGWKVVFEGRQRLCNDYLDDISED